MKPVRDAPATRGGKTLDPARWIQRAIRRSILGPRNDVGSKRPYALLSFCLLAVLSLATFSPAAQDEPVTTRTDAGAADDAALVFFETRIRPLLADNCVSCHGEKTRHGGLRLDTRADFEKGGDSGPLVTASDLEQSRLLRAVRHEGGIAMPPGGKLGAEQIADLARWVSEGAKWPKEAAPATHPSAASAAFPYPAQSRAFWSFLPVRNPPVPPVEDRAWCCSPLDAFVLAGLEKRGLRPAPPADRRTLLRRVTFDLTGLPPTPAESDAFATDPSPQAYEKVVDRLLASPRYGERWGRHWLDLVRYADSLDARGSGGEGDIREAWRYRDWVIEAFNRDLPYDQFVQNQIAGDLIAGDLLPPPAGQDFNVAGTIATGMLAIGEWGNGDADKDKILTDIADDQVDVVSRGFLGLTVSCARCHDHKFDPIPQKDYYGLAGIFFSSHILPGLTPKGQGENPLRIPLASAATRQRRSRWQARVDALETQLKTAGDAHRSAQAKELLPQTARYVMAAWEYARSSGSDSTNSTRPGSLAAWAGARSLHPFALDQWVRYLGLGDYPTLTTPLRDVLGTGGVHGWKNANGDDTPSLLVNTNDGARTLLTFTLPGRSVAIHPGPASGIAVGWTSPITGTVRLSGRLADADPNGGDGIAWKIEQRSHASSRRAAPLAAGDLLNGGAARGLVGGPLQTVRVCTGDILQLVVLPKQSHGFDTTLVDWTITETGKQHARSWNLAQDLNKRSDDPQAGVWRFYDLAASAQGPETPPGRWQRAVGVASDSAAAPVTPERVRAASEAFAQAFDRVDARSPFWPPSTKNGDAALPPAARAELARIAREQDALRKNAPPVIEYAHGAQEGGCPGSPHAGVHDVRVHLRGSYARLGDLVPRHFPVVLAGEKQPAIPPNRSGRLELARWLTTPTHPLTARVLVNRLWQHHFGQGIVRTPSNFGLLGERPTHPELLDWLATRFVKQGWSLKKMHRLMVLSATYRQASDAPPGTLRADPDNRLWGRMNRRRLSSEAIRDNLLAASGTLDATRRGGPAIADLASPCRTLYLRTVRSDRAGFGPLFDAANAASSVDQRNVSTSAPQALFLLNNPFVLDQARSLAGRLAREALPGDEQARIRHAYRLLYGRFPTLAETTVGRTFLARARSKGSTDRRAWERYAHLLLCANEFVYVD